MYKVTYRKDGTPYIENREFDTVQEALAFTNTMDPDFILEIKYYDSKIGNI
jgi:hypothetical protein